MSRGRDFPQKRPFGRVNKEEDLGGVLNQWHPSIQMEKPFRDVRHNRYVGHDLDNKSSEWSLHHL